MAIVIVTGARAPYTHVLYEALGEAAGEPVHVLTCTERETTRRWRIPPARAYRHEVLPGIRVTRSLTSTVYFNPAVVWRLLTLKPSLVIVNDFSPTSVMAALTARWLGLPLGVRTDSVPATDPGSRSVLHRLARRIVVRRSDFGIAPSDASAKLLAAYGLAGERIALTHLSPGWQPKLTAPAFEARAFDLLFCGTLDEPVKGALFFTDVVLRLAERGHHLAVRVTGDGAARTEMERRFAAAGIAVRFDGFVDQSGLEAVYASSRLLAYPSRGDVWGIAVNEAMQCGTPVLCSPHATAGIELLGPSGAGTVAPLNVDAWADAVMAMLDDRNAWRVQQAHALGAVSRFGLAGAIDDYRRVVNRYRSGQARPRQSPAQPG
jgi:glycosyltransferase involved in cell wall biosynthesis